MTMSKTKTLLLASWVFLLAIGLSVEAEAQRLDYDGCVAACEKQFPNILASEASCPLTMTAIRREFPGLKSFLTGYRCTGRHRGECEIWKTAATQALSKLSNLMLDTSDCRTLNAVSIRGWTHHFDTSRACRGDGEVTDFHDIVGQHEARIAKLNETAAGYTYGVERFDLTRDYGDRLPECAPGQKPRAYYVWPILEFFLAFEALPAYQSCVSRCKKPTAEQKALWEIEDRLAKMTRRLDKLAGQRASFKTLREELARENVSGIHFPSACRAFAALQSRLDNITGKVEAVTGVLARLGVEQSYSETVGQDLQEKLGEAEELLATVSFAAVEQACAEEDQRSAELEGTRRQLLEELMRNDSICLRAAGVFDSATSEGEQCNWIGDCSIPLFCREGVCEGEISIDAVSLLLQKARKLKDDGLALELRDETGLIADSGDSLVRLEANMKSLAAQCDKRGWGPSVAGWRDQFAKELEDRMSAVEQRIEVLTTRLGESELGESGRALLRRLGRKVKRTRGEAERLRKALGQADPVEEPSWLRIRLDDLQTLEEEVADMESDLQDALSVEGEEDSGMVYLLGGAGFLLLLGLLALVFFVRRKK